MPVYTSSNGIEAVEVTINLVKGQGLAAKDRNMMGKRTTSDPYCTIELLTTLPPVGRKKNSTTTTKVGETKPVLKTCDPEWNYTTTTTVPGAALANTDAPPMLKISIFDYDKTGDNDPMGFLTVPVPTGTQSVQTQDWYDVPKDSVKNAKGKLQIGLRTQVFRATALQKGNAFSLDNSMNRIRIGLAWDVVKGKAIDLDAACVALTKEGQVAMDDCVYYGNLRNSNDSIIHSGDERQGTKQGEDESMVMKLDKIPANILCLYIILTVASVKRNLSHITSARVTIVDDSQKNSVAPMAVFSPAEHISSSDATAMYLMRLAREGGSTSSWKVQPIEDTHPTARDFGSLIPYLKSYTRDLLPDLQVNPVERCSVMRKGGNISIKDYTPDNSIPSKVTFGLSWDMAPAAPGKKSEKIDLDASAICLNADLQLVDQIWYKQLNSDDGAIVHGGDQRSGKAAGDDERIFVELPKVSKSVHYIGFVVNSYSGQELDDIEKASCHLFDTDTEADIANHAISDCKFLDGHTALLMGCLYRVKGRGKAEDEWCLRIISQADDGKNVKAIVEGFQTYLEHNPTSRPMENDATDPDIEIAVSMPPETPIP